MKCPDMGNEFSVHDTLLHAGTLKRSQRITKARMDLLHVADPSQNQTHLNLSLKRTIVLRRSMVNSTWRSMNNQIKQSCQHQVTLKEKSFLNRNHLHRNHTSFQHRARLMTLQFPGEPSSTFFVLIVYDSVLIVYSLCTEGLIQFSRSTSWITSTYWETLTACSDVSTFSNLRNRLQTGERQYVRRIKLTINPFRIKHWSFTRPTKHCAERRTLFPSNPSHSTLVP